MTFRWKSFLRWAPVALVLITGSVYLTTCASLQSLSKSLQPVAPEVDFAGARVAGLDFSAADLLFDLDIQNPNPVGVTLAGFDYDLLINGKGFLKGEKNDKMEIAANGQSRLQIPLTIRYADLYATAKSLASADRSTYKLNCGVTFDVPLLGAVRVPVSQEGELPLLKLPSIKLADLKLNKLSFSGAELLAQIEVDNPNALDIGLKALQYNLEINGQSLASGVTRQQADIAAKGKSVISIPVALSFSQMGRAAYQMITGGETLNYRLSGNINATTSHELLQEFNLDFDQADRIRISR